MVQGPDPLLNESLGISATLNKKVADGKDGRRRMCKIVLASSAFDHFFSLFCFIGVDQRLMMVFVGILPISCDGKRCSVKRVRVSYELMRGLARLELYV